MLLRQFSTLTKVFSVLHDCHKKTKPIAIFIFKTSFIRPYFPYQVTLYLLSIDNKLLERGVYVHCVQLHFFYFLLNPVQLYFYHCIETTLNKVTSDFYIAKCQVHFSILISLDLAATFDNS